jgi:hypothetical protein
MGIRDFLDRLFGDDEESKRQYEKDIDDIMHIAFDEEESAMYDEFDELGQVPHSHPGDDEDGPITPPNFDPDDDNDDDSGGGGWLDWLLGRR